MAAVLLVEPDPEVRLVLEEGLILDGFSVFTANSVSEASLLLKCINFAAVVSEVVLPDGSGAYLSEKADGNPLPQILITASPAASTDLTARGVPHLRKPFSVTALAQCIMTLLDVGEAIRREPAQPGSGAGFIP